MIHTEHAFTCDFELMRFIEFSKPDHPNYLNTKLYGRGWAMRRVDGDVGAMCEMLEPDAHSIAEVARKLRRLKQWADHFQLPSKLPAMIAWAEAGPHEEPLIV